MNNLKPCPFCGKTNVKMYSAKDPSLHGFIHICKVDGDGMVKIESRLFHTEEQAIDAWNRRQSAQQEIVRCKDCKFYSPMNRETKTGICNLTMHQNFGDNWFCAGAERKGEES